MQNQSTKINIKIHFWSVVNLFFWLLVGLVILKLIVFQQVTVVGASMEPNYFTGEGLLVNQVYKGYNRGQVVAAYRDREVAKNADFLTKFSATIYLKRIIGLPGECIEVWHDKVIIYDSQCQNGQILDEEYLSPTTRREMINSNYYFPKTQITENNYFLMGDNRTVSEDSRFLGSFPKYSIFGEETVRFWPVGRLEFFQLPKYRFTSIDPVTSAQLEKAQNSYLSK